MGVQYPSPDGMMNVTLDEVDAYWGDVDVTSLLDPERYGSAKHKKLMEKRRFLFVVAVQMAEKGYLTGQNQPSPRALAETKAACPSLCASSSVKIKSSIRKGTREMDAHKQRSQGGPGQGSDPIQAASNGAVPSPILNGLLGPSDALATDPGPLWQPALGLSPEPSPNLMSVSLHASLDPKVAMNELAMRIWPRTLERLRYTVEGVGPFWATVWLPNIGKSFTGVECTKKQAERSAAAKALEFLQRPSGV